MAKAVYSRPILFILNVKNSGKGNIGQANIIIQIVKNSGKGTIQQANIIAQIVKIRGGFHERS